MQDKKAPPFLLFKPSAQERARFTLNLTLCKTISDPQAWSGPTRPLCDDVSFLPAHRVLGGAAVGEIYPDLPRIRPRVPVWRGRRLRHRLNPVADASPAAGHDGAGSDRVRRAHRHRAHDPCPSILHVRPN